MKVHYFQHVPFEGIGSIATWAAQRHHEVTATRFFDPKSASIPDPTQIDLLIVMGGPMNIYEDAQYPWLKTEKQAIERAIRHGLPVLGICLGAQLVADVLGAKIYANRDKEIGWWPIEWTSEAQSNPAFKDAPRTVFHWHGDTFDLPTGAVHLARSGGCLNQAYSYGSQGKVVGLQFHMEATPESVSDLVKHGADELIAARYIQTPSALLSETHHYAAIHSTMARLLDHMLQPVHP